MSAQRYHIGKNGPGPCNAHPERPGGRACRFGEERHGTQAEMIALWEREQEESQGESLLSGVSRSQSGSPSKTELNDLSSLEARKTLSSPSKYLPSSSDVSYSKNEQSVAMNLALEEFTALSHTPVLSQDLDWETNGFSSVHRYELTDGSVGYFKPFTSNSFEEGEYEDYGVSSLGASINEVNAYRMAEALGSGFRGLVPETVFREIDGEVGTLQRGVQEDLSYSPNFATNPELREDYRKAAILDFVIGNLDRHAQNYIYGVTEDGSGGRRSCIRLIDNSFSFPEDFKTSHFNSSSFATNRPAGDHMSESGSWIPPYNMSDRELPLDGGEHRALLQARSAVEGWIGAKTISEGRGRKVIERIDHLLKARRIDDLSDYLRETSRKSAR